MSHLIKVRIKGGEIYEMFTDWEDVINIGDLLYLCDNGKVSPEGKILIGHYDCSNISNDSKCESDLDTVSSLKKRIQILKDMIIERQMAKFCWCDKCAEGINPKKYREGLLQELDALLFVKELQNVKNSKDDN